MKKTEKTLLYEYIFNRTVQLQADLDNASHLMKYRRSDTLDAVEFMIAKERYDAFVEFSHDVMHLLHLMDKDGMEVDND